VTASEGSGPGSARAGGFGASVVGRLQPAGLARPPLQVPAEQRALGLQPAGQAHENGVHVLAFLRVLGRGLEQKHVVRIGELQGHAGWHLDQVLQVTLVPNEHPGDEGRHRVPVALLDPHLEVGEGGHLGDVVHEDDGVHVAVVVLHHALPKPLLASCVPHLHLGREADKGRLRQRRASAPGRAGCCGRAPARPATAGSCGRLARQRCHGRSRARARPALRGGQALVRQTSIEG